MLSWRWKGSANRVTIFTAPSDKGILGVAEAKRAAKVVVDKGSELTAAPCASCRECCALG